MRIVALTFTILLLFTACSNKSVNTVQVEQTEQVHMADEFENEFETQEEDDLFEGYNRVMTSFNDGLYEYVLDPVASGYAYVVPQTARKGISNAFSNLMFPIRFVNNVLQLKFENAAEELGRFVINSTFGLLGLIDVADMHTNLEQHDEDFGQTLGFYGVPSGPHIVLPFLGPSNLRDVVGMSVDSYADPTMSTDRNWKIPENIDNSLAIKSGYYLNKASLHLGEYENLKKDAIDLYPFLRDVYEQKRERQIKE